MSASEPLLTSSRGPAAPGSAAEPTLVNIPDPTSVLPGLESPGPAPAPGPPAQGLAPVKASVLLVDDRPDKLLALESILNSPDLELVKARSGKEALRHLLKREFAVILLDVSMPGMDGFETAAIIRQRLSSERTPIIFVTAMADTLNHVSRGYSLGAVDYLMTPIVPEVLRTKVSVFVELYRQGELVRIQAEQLRSLNRQLNARLASLTDINRELETFNYSIAHDLRAPLRAMSGFAKALLEDEADKLSPEGLEYAKRVVRSAQHMDALLKDLLTYSALTATQLSLAAVVLEQPVTAALAVFERELRERGVQVEVASPLGKARAHLPTLNQILANLIDNAVKFAASDRLPRLRIFTTRQSGSIRLWVEDNGIGIPRQHHERIFGLFRRLHNLDEYPGTGIGLAIVRRGAERMGGRVGVESESGQGSRFWVELPEG